MRNTMSSTPASWGHRIAVEEIGGVPFLMYVERPKRIGDLFAFAERWGARPYVVREGLGLEAGRYHGPHLPDVGGHRPHASDHAALVVDFPGL